MNPQESQEIQRQVDELLAKEMIREGLSSCAVMALLVSKKDGSVRMSVDSRAIDKTIALPIPRLKTSLMSYIVPPSFLRLIVEVATTKLRSIRGAKCKTAFKTKNGCMSGWQCHSASPMLLALSFI